jgi:hypothetical protein
MKRIMIAIAAAVAVLTAGCSAAASAHHAAPAPAPSHSVAGPGVPASSGPFKITPVYCGEFSPAQVTQFADVSGLIFRYTNVSASEAAAPVLTVNFTKGNEVSGSNVNGYLPDIKPGQSAYGDVGAVGAGGQSLRFHDCQMVSYTVDHDPQARVFNP